MNHLRLSLTALFFLAFAGLYAQVPSSCAMPQVLEQAYRDDLANLALRDMYLAQSPDTQSVFIPNAWKTPIADGLAAIFNVSNVLERDSVFDIYCVHDRTSGLKSYRQYLIQIDTTYAWTQAWRNLVTLTGNPSVDAKSAQYGLHVIAYYEWNIGNFVVLESDFSLNNQRLIEQLVTESGILDGEPNANAGVSGRITYQLIGEHRYYDFYHEFGDCESGCMASRAWHFRVGGNCSVEYLGFSDSAPVSFNPLPEPKYCNLTTNIAQPMPMQFQVYPNPAREYLQITSPVENEQPTLAELYDSQGHLVMRSGEFLDQVRLNTSELAHGLYSLVIKQQGCVVDVRHILH